jgi:hypothetical protein
MASRAEAAAATNGPEKAAEDGEKNEKKQLVEGKLPEDDQAKLIREEQLAAIRGDPVEREGYFMVLPLMARCAQLFHQSREPSLRLRDGIATLGHAKGLVEATDDRQSG